MGQQEDVAFSTTSLWIESLALLQSKWPEALLEPHNVETLAAAEEWFMGALAQADSRDVVDVLGQLLLGPWIHGQAWLSPQVCRCIHLSSSPPSSRPS